MRIELSSPTAKVGPSLTPVQAQAPDPSTATVLGSEKAHDQLPAQQQGTDLKDPVSSKQLEEITEKMNRAMKALNHSLQFKVVNKSHIVIKVIDSESGEVIREIPPERLITAFENVESSIGILLDEKK